MDDAYLQAIHDFAKEAESCCRTIERCHELGFDDFLFELDATLPLLYLRAHALIVTAPDDIFEVEPPPTEDLNFEELIHGSEDGEGQALGRWKGPLEALLGMDDTHYVGVAYTGDSESGLPPDTEVLWHSTSSELSELYESIRDALALYRQGDFENAGHDWVFGFYKWGEYLPHLVGETFHLCHATINAEEAESGL